MSEYIKTYKTKSKQQTDRQTNKIQRESNTQHWKRTIWKELSEESIERIHYQE